MKAVLDTNIVIVATITLKGPLGRIISAWRTSSFVWSISSPLLKELERAFTYPRVQRHLALSSGEVSEFLQLVRQTAIVIEPEVTLDVVANDPDDSRVIEVSFGGQADYLVTNDGDLLGLKSFEGVEIVTASRFRPSSGVNQLLAWSA